MEVNPLWFACRVVGVLTVTLRLWSFYSCTRHIPLSCRCQHLRSLSVQCIRHGTYRLHQIRGLSFNLHALQICSNMKRPMSDEESLRFCLPHYQDFVTALSILLRGSVQEKLQWTFNLYDINRDGYINKEVPKSRNPPSLHPWMHVLRLSLSVSVCLAGDDRHRQSHLWHDGEVHLPCVEDGRTQTARGCLLSGSSSSAMMDTRKNSADDLVDVLMFVFLNTENGQEQRWGGHSWWIYPVLSRGTELFVLNGKCE